MHHGTKQTSIVIGVATCDRHGLVSLRLPSKLLLKATPYSLCASLLIRSVCISLSVVQRLVQVDPRIVIHTENV